MKIGKTRGESDETNALEFLLIPHPRQFGFISGVSASRLNRPVVPCHGFRVGHGSNGCRGEQSGVAACGKGYVRF